LDLPGRYGIELAEKARPASGHRNSLLVSRSSIDDLDRAQHPSFTAGPGLNRRNLLPKGDKTPELFKVGTND
jgi:hypothetical protein